MNPTVKIIDSERDVLEIQISGVHVSVVNALRRTLLSDIPRIVLHKSAIEINTAPHFHNEMVKHRIQCIPVHPVKGGRRMTNEEIRDFVENHYISVDVVNETEEVQYVTTRDFKIYRRGETAAWKDNETREIFPAYRQHYFIDIMRLNPRRSVNSPGEHFKATIEMSLDTAKTDGCFTVVSTCAFQNTPDVVKSNAAWQKQEQVERKQMADSGQGVNEELIAFKKRDFELLDAQRYFKENSFDFFVESNGIYENRELITAACQILMARCQDVVDQINQDVIRMVESKTRVQRGGAEYSTMPNAVDIILPRIDYTMGYLLDFMMFTLFFEGEKKLSYCGFTKYHPHLNESVLRLAFFEEEDIALWKSMMGKSAEKIAELFREIQTPFAKKTAAPRVY